MRGSTLAFTSEICLPAPDRRERMVFVLLALAMLGAVVPVGPAALGAEAASVRATCSDGTATEFGRFCAPVDQVAMAEPSAASRIARILMP